MTNDRIPGLRIGVAFLCYALTFQVGCGAASSALHAPSAMGAQAAPSPVFGPHPAVEVAPGAAPARALASPASVPAPVLPAPGGASTPPSPRTVPAASPAAAPASKVDARAAKTAAPTRAAVIVYEGEVRMVADEAVIAKTIDRIVDVAESLGGHIAGRKDASVTVKVPSASFREALTQIDALGVPVVGRSVKADDVSEEFHDLEVRLANLRSTRARLSDFLARAANIADMLTVERELERVALEIDRIEGRLEFLRARAAMSVIAVSIAPKPKEIAVVARPPSPPPPLRAPELPVRWVSRVGVEPLLSLHQ